MLSGLLATPLLVGLYGRLRETESGFALWSFILGSVAAIGTMVYGGYDLALAVNRVAGAPALPSAINPRELLTFGLMGIAVIVIAWLISRRDDFSRNLAYLGYVLAVLLLWLYLGRLVILDPTNPAILVPALLVGFIANPLWYV